MQTSSKYPSLSYHNACNPARTNYKNEPKQSKDKE